MNRQIIQSLAKIKGIKGVCAVHPEERQEILALEEEAEKRSLMGLGKVINTGVREVLQFESVFVALTTMDFEWGQCSALILKKGDKLVGESVYDDAIIAKLSKAPNVWFMHKNFVIYKDLVSFPKDIMQKVCHFEIPSLPGNALYNATEDGMHSEIVYGIPSTYCDVHLKELYFDSTEEQGLGTILISVNFISDREKEE